MPYVVLLFLLALASCAPYGPSRIPSYKLQVAQGNVLSDELLERVRAGMAKQEVIELLGTPALPQSSETRLYYVFAQSRNTTVYVLRAVVIDFDRNGRVARIQKSTPPGSGA